MIKKKGQLIKIVDKLITIPISTNSDSGKTTMKKLLLLDTDVVIDLHSLGFFEKMSRSYNLFLTREVFEEAKHYAQKVNLIIGIQLPVTK
jgi:hypothetical protein